MHDLAIVGDDALGIPYEGKKHLKTDHLLRVVEAPTLQSKPSICSIKPNFYM